MSIQTWEQNGLVDIVKELTLESTDISDKEFSNVKRELVRMGRQYEVVIEGQIMEGLTSKAAKAKIIQLIAKLKTMSKASLTGKTTDEKLDFIKSLIIVIGAIGAMGSITNKGILSKIILALGINV